MTIVLDETSLVEEEEVREIHCIKKSNEEENQTRTETDSEEEEDLPREIEKIQIHAVVKRTLVKSTPKATIWIPPNQGKSSQKKARKVK